MTDKTNKLELARQVKIAFTIKLSVNSLVEEVYQGHVGSVQQTKRIVRQTAWINDELNRMKEYFNIYLSQDAQPFIGLAEKSVSKMILDFNKLGVVANQMAIERIRQQDSTAQYRAIRVLINSVLHSSSQLYNQLRSLEMM